MTPRVVKVARLLALMVMLGFGTQAVVRADSCEEHPFFCCEALSIAISVCGGLEQVDNFECNPWTCYATFSCKP